MSLDYINLHVEEVNYSSILEELNIEEFTDAYKNIVDQYTTPKRAYVKTSARGLNAKEVDFETLAYIYDSCHQCSQKERLHAMVVCLHNFYNKTQSVSKTQELQKQLVKTMKTDKTNANLSFDWVDEFSKDNHIFYLLEITIGNNKMFKFGITSNRLRQRIATLKHDINANYTKQALSIKVLLILECEDNKLFEDEVKILITEYNFKQPNYSFKGYTELLKCDNQVYTLIEQVSNKYNSKILHDSRVGTSPIK